ncbi:hypothetical protein HK100_009708, partial [Physocladia obscura]
MWVLKHNGDHLEWPCTFFTTLSTVEDASEWARNSANGWSSWFKYRFTNQERDTIASETILASTEHLSKPLTVCWAWSLCFSTRQSRSICVIHVIGAEEYETFTGYGWIDILHALNAKTVEIWFIGPKLTVPDSCRTETRGEKSITFIFKAGLYQTLVHNPPDFVIAFNCGFHVDIVSWKPALEKIKALKVPLCFTSFDANEARQDARVFESLGINKTLLRTNEFGKRRRRLRVGQWEAVFSAGVNPFRSLVP